MEEGGQAEQRQTCLRFQSMNAFGVCFVMGVLCGGQSGYAFARFRKFCIQLSKLCESGGKWGWQENLRHISPLLRVKSTPWI
jgi:hypothetical protein